MQPTRPLKPAHITLDTLPDLFAYRRAQFGGWTMTSTPPEPDPPADPPADPDPTPDPKVDPAKVFSQADVDAMVSKRLSEEKVRFDKQLKDLQDSAGKSELEKTQAERDRNKTERDQAIGKAAERVAKTEAKVAALTLRAREDRLPAILSQADLTDAVGEDGEVDDAKVKAAVEKVLTDFPEWKKGPGQSGNELGSGDDGKRKPSFTRKEIAEMSPAERAKRIDELNEAMAAGRVTG